MRQRGGKRDRERERDDTKISISVERGTLYYTRIRIKDNCLGGRKIKVKDLRSDHHKKVTIKVRRLEKKEIAR